MCAPNLLQFVPNDYIANNYLKTNFYLKDVLCYRKVEEKITGTMPSNLKFDDSEGKAKNWSLLRTCLKSGQFDMIVQKRMITYELPQQSLTAPI